MKLLVTGAAQLNEAQLKTLSEMGNEIFFMQNEKEKVPVSYEEIEGIICNGLFLFHEIERFKNLKYIQLTSAGFDRVPIDYIKKQGIEIHNAKGVYSIPMAEYAISSVLQIYKKTDFFCSNQKKRTWEKNRNIRELFGKMVCIVGCGNIGTECAKKFNAFGCNVFGIDAFLKEEKHFSEIYQPDKAVEAFSKADIVILTLPLTEETRHLIGAKELSAMPDESIIINLSRGAVVDTKALLKELEKERIFAVLDVFEEEPLPEDSPFWNMENVLITPHNSFVGEHNAERLWKVIKTNLKNKLI